MIFFFTALLFAAALFLLPFVPSLMAPHMVRREAALAARPPQNALQRFIRWLPAAGSLVVLILVCALAVRQMRDKRICAFHFSHDRSIVLLYNDFMAEVEIPITYQAYVASQLIQGPTACSGTPIPFRATAANFRAYEFTSGKVVIEQQDNSDTPWRLIVEYYFSATPSPRVNRELKSFPGEASQGKTVLPEDLLP